MSNQFQRILVAALAAGCSLATPILAQEMDLDGMMDIIEQKLGDAAARQEAIEAGEERTLLCKYCHGADGNSLKPEVPNLAGQNVRYLLEQIDKFSNGQRKDFVMNQLAENFSVADKINIAIFYHSMSVKQVPVDAARAAKGRPLYDNHCSACHGGRALGGENLARLAGQKSDYVKTVLKQFRANGSGQGGKTKRNSEVMEQVVKHLSDEQIDALAAYVAQLR